MDWTTATSSVRDFVHQVTKTLRNNLGDNLQGIILHGSLAMGCFYEPKSDLDILAIIDEPLNSMSRRMLSESLVNLHQGRPMVGGLEFHLLNAKAIWPFSHPLPFELHFSESYLSKFLQGYDLPHNHVDEDLAANIMVARTRGISLFGQQPSELLPSVPWTAYKSSVLEDFQWIIEGRNILSSPFYSVLNMCRTIQLLRLRDGTVASKEEGALWALKELPDQYHPVIDQALSCYRSGQLPKSSTAEERRLGGIDWDAETLLTFRDYAVASAIQ